MRVEITATDAPEFHPDDINTANDALWIHHGDFARAINWCREQRPYMPDAATDTYAVAAAILEYVRARKGIG